MGRVPALRDGGPTLDEAHARLSETDDGPPVFLSAAADFLSATAFMSSAAAGSRRQASRILENAGPAKVKTDPRLRRGFAVGDGPAQRRRAIRAQRGSRSPCRASVATHQPRRCLRPSVSDGNKARVCVCVWWWWWWWEQTLEQDRHQ